MWVHLGTCYTEELLYNPDGSVIYNGMEYYQNTITGQYADAYYLKYFSTSTIGSTLS